MNERKMKILMLNYEFPPLGGGAGNATLYILKEFAKLPIDQIEIDLITSSVSTFRIEKFAPNITIHYLDIGKDNNIHYQSIINILTYSWKSFSYSRKLIKQKKFDLIHAFFGIPSGFVAMFLHLPYIVSLRGSDVPFYNKRFRLLDTVLFRNISKKIWKKASLVIANSQGLKELAHETLADITIEVITNGVDCDFFKPSDNRKALSEYSPLKLVSTGRLIKRKGYENLITALKDLQNIKLTLIGGGNLSAHLQQVSKERAVEVDFTGVMEHNEIPQYLTNSDIFVLPSSSEGMSNSILEAMACGLPIITTNVGGTKELIQNNGLVLENNESETIKEKILHYIQNPILIKEHGRQSREIAQTYSWSNISRKYLNTFQQIIQNNEESKSLC
jgi:glycosyltransferase involved in cell wall biosynthesis